MQPADDERSWFWVTLAMSSVTIVALVFATWELVENHFFRDVDYLTLHYLYITRGIGSSLLLAFWAAWYVLRQQRRSAEELRRSREHYRGLLESSPGAVALYDSALCVTEWNATAKRLYGFEKGEVLNRPLPTVPQDRRVELKEFLRRVEEGESMVDADTQRIDKRGMPIDVHLSLLPFRQPGDDNFFLEVTSDIRERVRLQQKLLEIEKLTSMGKMAAGTAHHLSTPLTAILLRVQMMQDRADSETHSADLERLESGIRFCQQFVQRLLVFSRPAAASKRPVDVAQTIDSVVSFLSPALSAKQAEVSTHIASLEGSQILADRSLLEALFSILITNALDAVSPGGQIAIRCTRPEEDLMEIQIVDSGSGIAPDDLPHIFEPFFSTKEPGKGTGLGLAIAKNIVAEHGGSIRLESELGRGTTALIKLPVFRADSLADTEK